MYDNKSLICKISYLEDKLLRSKNNYEIEKLQRELTCLRAKLQKKIWDGYDEESY